MVNMRNPTLRLLLDSYLGSLDNPFRCITTILSASKSKAKITILHLNQKGSFTVNLNDRSNKEEDIEYWNCRV